MIGMPGPVELLIILALVALVFGTSKLKNVGKDLGGHISDLKDGLREGGGKDEKKEEAPVAPAEEKTEEKVEEKAAK